MLPGLFIDKIIRSLKRNVNLVALVLVCVGLLCVGVFSTARRCWPSGRFAPGLGMGSCSLSFYDKAATIAPPRSATLALSFVMSVNYLAVMVCPFIVDLFRHVFGTHSDRFPFFSMRHWCWPLLSSHSCAGVALRSDSTNPITGIDCKTVRKCCE